MISYMITYGKTVFLTTTYSRDRLLDDTWRHANTDFNRYIQKLRRLPQGQMEYLRTIEAHRDGYPHFHAILRFHTVLAIDNCRYFRPNIYASWKKAWTKGLSDAQPPRNKQSPLAYIIKYTTKQSGNRIWKRYYRHLDVSSAELPHTPSSLIKKDTLSVSPVTPLSKRCAENKIKQCTWSRRFFESLLTH